MLSNKACLRYMAYSFWYDVYCLSIKSNKNIESTLFSFIRQRCTPKPWYRASKRLQLILPIELFFYNLYLFRKLSLVWTWARAFLELFTNLIMDEVSDNFRWKHAGLSVLKRVLDISFFFNSRKFSIQCSLDVLISWFKKLILIRRWSIKVRRVFKRRLIDISIQNEFSIYSWPKLFNYWFIRCLIPFLIVISILIFKKW